MKIKNIIISFDFALAIFIGFTVYYILPFWITNTFAKSMYEIGITVLSITFSVFFAALAIIISSSDDDFIIFLGDNYTILINVFKFSLFLLFLALLYSIVLTAVTAAWIENKYTNQQEYFIAIYSFLFSYSLFCTFGSVLDSLSYAKHRSRHIKVKSKNTSN